MSIPAIPTIHYPDSDGNPMADNTRPYEEIVVLKTNLDALFADTDRVFVAADLLWYPTEGDNRTRLAPDVFVAFGRPKGHRGSYRQWDEGGVAPHVVFEILSPGNRLGEMLRKLEFYDRYGVEEYYVYDPESTEFTALRRAESGRLETIPSDTALVSPRLGVCFVLTDGAPWQLSLPDGRPFARYQELVTARDRADAEARRADAEAHRANSESERAQRLAQRLRALGIDPDTV
jgi:Uma2 family endonuclease